MKCATLILAAGASSRMGKPKQLLQIGNASMLYRVIKNAVNSTTADVFVVLGAEADSIKDDICDLPIEIIFNPNYKNGLSSSIAKGIKRLYKYDAVLILLADQLMISGSYLNKMVSELKNHPNTIIVSDYNGVKGVPALFPKRYYTNLLKLKGDKGAKQFLNSDIVATRTIISSVNLLDVDTPEDYQKLIQDID